MIGMGNDLPGLRDRFCHPCGGRGPGDAWHAYGPRPEPIEPRAGGELPEKLIVQVPPLRVVLLDQPQLPCSLASLQLLLARNGITDMAEGLEVYQAMHGVSLCEAGDLAAPVLIDSAREVSGHGDVKRAVPFARQNVDGGTLSLPRSSGFLPSQE